MPTAELTIAADLSGLRKQLESIPGMTAEQAKNMTAELNKSFKAAERAAKKAADATKASMEEVAEATRDAAKSTKGLEDRFGAVGGSAAKLAGGLDLLAPGLGDLARGVADIADVGEVASGSIGLSGLAGSVASLAGPLAIAGLALTPLIVAFMDEKHQAEAAAAALARYEEATKAASAANAEFDTAIGDVNDQFKLLFGLETQNEQASRKSEAALRAKAEAANASARALIAEAEAQRAAIKGAATMDAIRGSETDATRQYAKLSDTIKEQTAIIAQNDQAVELSAEVLREKAKADDQAERNAKRRAAAEKAAAEAARKAAEAERLANEAIAEHAAMLDPLVAAEKKVESQRQAELTKSEALSEELDNLRALKLQLAAAGQLSAEEAARFAGVEKAMAEDLTQALIDEEAKRQEGIATIRKKAQDKADADEKDRKAKEAEERAQRLTAIAQVTDVIAQYTSASLDADVAAYERAQEDKKALGKNATEAEKKLAAERVAATRNAARKAFLIDKAAKMASAASATALAVVQAYGSAPPPFNYIAAAAVGAAGLIQQGIIMSQNPTFHAGGFVGDMAPDEQRATVRRGEAVLSPQGRRAMGDDAIRAANAGMGGGQTIMVQQVYRHRVFDSFIADNLRTRGPLARALGSGGRAGQRRS
jgi:hypothetical protein